MNLKTGLIAWSLIVVLVSLSNGQDRETGKPSAGKQDPKQGKSGVGGQAGKSPGAKTAPEVQQKSDSSQSQNPSTNQDSGSEVTSPPSTRSATSNALDAYLSSARRQRLGRTPRMFGDWFRPGMVVTTASETPGPTTGIFSTVQVPLVARVGKISENNSALPVDRIFFNYNYFHNATNGSVVGPDAQSSNRSVSPERYTLGWERTFLDGLTSLEARFVMNNVPDIGHNPVGNGPSGYQAFSPTAGNLTLVGKLLLLENESTVMAAGLGVEAPTGGDTFVQSGSTTLQIQNQAVYLSPYIGLLKKPVDSPWFLNAFVQLETPLTGDRVVGIDPTGGTPIDFGRLTSETVLYADVAIGRWFYQQPGALVSGVAGFFETHYSAAMTQSDSIADSYSVNSFSTDYTLNPVRDRFEVIDLTAGIHIELADTTRLRIGAVFPVSKDRAFDGELGVQLTRIR